MRPGEVAALLLVSSALYLAAAISAGVMSFDYWLDREWTTRESSLVLSIFTAVAGPLVWVGWFFAWAVPPVVEVLGDLGAGVVDLVAAAVRRKSEKVPRAVARKK